MFHRSAPWLVPAALLAACAPDVSETVPEKGAVGQVRATWNQGAWGMETWIFVVDDRPTAEAEARRATLLDVVARATAEHAAQPRSVWLDVDLRAIVVGASGKRVVDPEDDQNLVWRDENANARGAERFSRAIAAAAGSLVLSDDLPDDLIRAAAAAKTRLEPGESQTRRVVVVGQWDQQRLRDAVAKTAEGEGWDTRGNFDLEHDNALHVDSGVHYWCAPRRLDACAVRVHLGSGTCEQRRLNVARGVELAGAESPRVVCDVPMLQGSAAATCADRYADGGELQSGFCFADMGPRCPFALRLAGGARPRDAFTDIVCNLH